MTDRACSTPEGDTDFDTRGRKAAHTPNTWCSTPEGDTDFDTPLKSQVERLDTCSTPEGDTDFDT